VRSARNVLGVARNLHLARPQRCSTELDGNHDIPSHCTKAKDILVAY
jgi:hypothetical protein